MSPRPRWLRFSLRTGLVLVTVVCALLAVLGRRAQRVLSQKRAVEAILAAGGKVIDDTDRVALDPFCASDWKLALGLARLPRVTEVVLMNDLSDEGSHAGLPYLKDLPDLVSLELIGDWAASCWKHVEPLDSLSFLVVEWNANLTAKEVARLVRPKLESLVISEGDLHGLEEMNVVWPHSLRCICIDGCAGLSGRGFVQLLQPGLEQINVDGAEFRDEDLLGAAVPPNLRFLSITNCRRLTARGIQPLLGDKLEHLILPGAELDDIDICGLRFPPGLRWLEIGGQRLTNKSVEWIVDSCPRLEVLQMQSPTIDDRAVGALARLSVCRSMNLLGAAMTPTGCAELSRRLGAWRQVITTHGTFRGDQLHRIGAKTWTTLQPREQVEVDVEPDTPRILGSRRP